MFEVGQSAKCACAEAMSALAQVPDVVRRPLMFARCHQADIYVLFLARTKLARARI